MLDSNSILRNKSVISIICLSLLLLNHHNINAQTVDDQFVKIFEKETSCVDFNVKQQLLLTQGAEVLPNWFWQIPVSTENSLYAIGISDPKIKCSKIATTQAYERAIMQFSLMLSTQVKGTSDIFTENAGNANKYEESFIYIGAPINGKCMVIDSASTRFGEIILLVKYDKDEYTKIPIKTVIKKYESLTKAENGWYSYQIVSNYLQNDTVLIGYQYTKCNTDFLIESFYNGCIHNIPLGMYDYSCIQDQNTDEESSTCNSIKIPHKGLWFGYLQSFIDGLSIIASNSQSLLKKVDQIEQISKDVSIIRNVVKSNIRFFIKEVHPIDGNIAFEFSRTH